MNQIFVTDKVIIDLVCSLRCPADNSINVFFIMVAYGECFVNQQGNLLPHICIQV